MCYNKTRGRQMRKFFKEFKAFISRGNVFDLAVGMIIATAFNKIVSSLVNDIIMPLITWATGKASLADLSIVLRRAADGTATLTWKYGNFIQTIIDFMIIALSVFIMVKIVTNSRKKFKEFEEMIITETKKETKALKKECRKLAKEQKRPFKIVYQEHVDENKRLAEEKVAKEKAEKERLEAEEKLKNPSEQQLLKEIRDYLINQDKKEN